MVTVTEAELKKNQSGSIVEKFKSGFDPLSTYDNDALTWTEKVYNPVTYSSKSYSAQNSSSFKNIKHLADEHKHLLGLRDAHRNYKKEKDLSKILSYIRIDLLSIASQKLRSFYLKYWAETLLMYPGKNSYETFITKKFTIHTNESDSTEILSMIQKRAKESQIWEAELIQKRAELRYQNLIEKRTQHLNDVKEKYKNTPAYHNLLLYELHKDVKKSFEKLEKTLVKKEEFLSQTPMRIYKRMEADKERLLKQPKDKKKKMNKKQNENIKQKSHSKKAKGGGSPTSNSTKKWRKSKNRSTAGRK